MLRNRPPDTFDTLKADLFRAFKPVNYEDHLEVRLRSRQQRTSEPFTDYFYYMFYMCSRIEPNMPEREKIQHLYRGLPPAKKRESIVLSLPLVPPMNSLERLIYFYKGRIWL